MTPVNRRTFLKKSALGAATIGFSARSWAQVKGANDDIRVAVVGFNGQGKSHIENFKKVPGVRIVALCDVDSAVLDPMAKKLSDQGTPVEKYSDIRKMLENKDIDAFSTATPNHWHALIAIWGVQAGKDVYVEKPVSHNVSEGRRIVEAARKHGRIVQTGTQCRSSTGLQEAIAYIQAGSLGKIKLARGLCYKRRPSIGKVSGPQEPPSTVDYDLWCGPAPKEPLMRTKLHYDWHWVWPTGCGDLGNQGIHQMDIARWALGEKELSPRVFSIGGRFGYVDDGTTPNTELIFHDYKAAPLIFEVRGLPIAKGEEKMDNYEGASIGVVVDCENGHLVIPSYDTATVFDKDWKEVKQFKGSTSHHANFIKAVRSRRHEDLNADILEGHISSALCHTGNISYRLGSQESPDSLREKIKGDKEASESYDRFRKHLDANGVDLEATKPVLGVSLKMDPKKERFSGNEKANQMLTRDYRKGFEVPQKV